METIGAEVDTKSYPTKTVASKYAEITLPKSQEIHFGRNVLRPFKS